VLEIEFRVGPPYTLGNEIQAEAIKRLEAFNAAKEIAEAEKKKKASKRASEESLPTISPTAVSNQPASTDQSETVSHVN
jgi:hypothetical protein